MRSHPPELPPPADVEPGHAGADGHLSQSEVLSALSYALDITEGAPAGHTLRACAIGMRLADELGLDTGARSALYYALLLKDAGCSSNAARLASVFGAPDQVVKQGLKLVDWDRTLPLALFTARMAGMGSSLVGRARRFLGVAREDQLTRRLIEIRCDRGAEIVRQLGFPEATADAVRSLDEHWSGEGYPQGLRGEAIPLLSRIALLAQTVEIFHAAHGVEAAVAVARQRRGSWFDPRLVDRVARWAKDRAWWERLGSPELGQWVVESEPGGHAKPLDDQGLDTIAGAFADIIDAKSPYTYRHSRNVAAYACAIGDALGVTPAERRVLYRAGLLHDIGKLGISSHILDKQGPLTPEERLEIERHPLYSWQILRRVGAFREFAWTASVHHEKLDGTGYPWKLAETQLSSTARILCVADIFEALTADRPYRAGMEPAVALDIIRRDAPHRLCGVVVEGLAATLV